MSDTTRVITPGTEVVIHGDRDRLGCVIEARIIDADGTVRYRVAWMDGSERQVATLHPKEIRTHGPDVQYNEIGFFRPQDRETKA